MEKKLYIIVPCYNEEEVLEMSANILLNKLNMLMNKKLISSDSKILFVNDGSKDKTWDIISKLCDSNKAFEGIKLSHNRGHQNALLAGLTYSVDYADITITIDADLQDDVDTLEEMINKCLNGSDIVFGVRKSRKKDSFFKRSTAALFYKFMKFMGVEIVYNHADYRLMTNRAVEFLLQYKESNLFLRGLVPLIGLNTDKVTYDRKERMAGDSKYPLKKMIKFAFDGITSFSVKPLKLIANTGIFTTIISFMFGIIYMILVLNGVWNYNNFHFLLIIIIFLYGNISLFLGIIGEYVGKIYKESKNRPRFFIEDIKTGKKE